jgi:Spy/CpxP family protein refolding chaperone
MKDGLESLGRVRAKGLALLLITFVAGSLAGVALERIMAAQRTPELVPPMGMMRPGMEVPFPMMFSELGLTPDQQTRIREIMEQSRPRTEDVLQETLPRLRALTDSVRQEIRSVLTPEQAATMDSLIMTMRHRGRWQGGRGPGKGQQQPPRRRQ